MTALPLCRSALRRSALPMGVGLTSGLLLLHRQQPMRFDALNSEPIARRQFSSNPKHTQRKEILSPEVIKQLSGGSVAGFISGLLVSVFSKTLVLLIGIGLVLIQVAARYGVDLVEHFKLKKRLQSSPILAALRYNPTFKIAFAVTFALSAFMSF